MSVAASAAARPDLFGRRPGVPVATAIRRAPGGSIEFVNPPRGSRAALCREEPTIDALMASPPPPPAMPTDDDDLSAEQKLAIEVSTRIREAIDATRRLREVMDVLAERGGAGKGVIDVVALDAARAYEGLRVLQSGLDRGGERTGNAWPIFARFLCLRAGLPADGPMPALRIASLILDFVASKRRIPTNEIIAMRRRQDFVFARHEVVHALRTTLTWSLPQIGRFLGDRDHTTILHSTRRFPHLAARGLVFDFTENPLASCPVAS